MEKRVEKSLLETKLIRTQRFINLKMAKADRTMSKEALPTINGIAPINIEQPSGANSYTENIRTHKTY